MGGSVMVGVGGMNPVSTTGPSTTGASTTGASTTVSTTTGGTGGTGGCGIRTACCDPSIWPDADPVPVTMTDCSDFDSEVGPEGVHCIMPGGIWSVDVDGRGTPKQDSSKIEPCGTTGNGLHFVGHGHTSWGADVAAAIVSPTQPVDVSAFAGMSFVMKSATASSLIFKVQNSYSQPACGKCTEIGVIGNECYSGYVKTIALRANDTTPLVVHWTDLTQQLWGYRPPGTVLFDPRDLISVAFAFDVNIDFDVCLDDVKFVR
jgi:hypothetical protein